MPEHEQRLGEILRAELPGVLVSLSARWLHEQQEYERTATTVVNAYVGPVMGGYLGGLRDGLAGRAGRAPLRIMQSSGGLMRDAEAAARPVYVLESGPAAGVLAGSRWPGAGLAERRSRSTWAARRPRPR